MTIQSISRRFLLLLGCLGALLAGSAQPVAADPSTRPSGSQLPRIAVLGDSLSAGYGLPAEAAFPARLQQALAAAGCRTEVINGGVSGDTSAGGLARLDWLLADAPHLVIVELGANDALRALPPEAMEKNLAAILGRLREKKIGVLLTGMRAPRNLGEAYVKAYEAVFPRLAARYKVPLYPFFLEGVAGEADLNQPDGLHPNARGVEEIVRRILPHVQKSLVKAP